MTVADRNRVLLLGANDRAMLTFARQLNRMGFAVEVADGSPQIVQHSQSVERFHLLTSPAISASGTVGDLVHLLEERSFGFIIPITDEALELCVSHRHQLEARTVILGLPSEATYLLSHDKGALFEKCRELDVPVPQGVLVRALDELPGDLDALGCPLIIKPVFSRLLKQDRVLKFTVRTAKDSNSAIDSVRELVGSCPVLLQEMLGGHGAGYNFLAKDGEVLLEYAHERVSEPIEGGQSSYRRTIPVDTYGLSEYSRRILRSVSWTGIGMVEYRIEGDDAYVMEINGRPWGSIELGVFAGVNIPEGMVRLFWLGDRPEPVEAQSVFARNLKLDVRYALKRAMRQRSPIPMLRWMWGLRRSLSKSEIVEDNPFRDIRYGLREYAGLLREALERTLSKVPRAKEPPMAEIELKKGSRIGFLCFGNICRSPFAEAYARSRFPDFEFSSYGTYPIPDRMVPAISERVGRELYSLDLREHRSRMITEDDVESLDVIFAMDNKNVSDLLVSFPAASGKVRLLGSQSGIEDPYGKREEDFVEAFGLIAEALEDVFGGAGGR